MKMKRLIRVFYLRILRTFKGDKRVRKPKKLTESENKACEIFLTVLHNKDSKLYYDIKTQECYIGSGDKTIFVFLEANNVKVINSVFGYDVHIKSDLENYLYEVQRLHSSPFSMNLLYSIYSSLFDKK